MLFLFALPASIHLYINLSNFESTYLCISWMPELDTARYGNALSQYMANFKIVSSLQKSLRFQCTQIKMSKPLIFLYITQLLPLIQCLIISRETGINSPTSCSNFHLNGFSDKHHFNIECSYYMVGIDTTYKIFNLAVGLLLRNFM